ncbi:MAG: carboxypeptidase-like regulatory domain-containing protein, partial [Terriglobales bacterium]
MLTRSRCSRIRLAFAVCLLAGVAAASPPPHTGASERRGLSRQNGRAGQNITGAVLDMTTGAALGNAPVTLVLLQGSMQPVGSTTADAQGHYRFSQTQSGPYMVETDHQGVSYFAQVTPGQSETNLNVYDVARDPKLMDVDAEIMVLQPDQGQLAVVNEYRIENALRPLRTLAQKGGMFRFRVPAGAHVDMVHV